MRPAIQILDTDRPIALNGPLLPAETCRSVIQQIDADLDASPSEASEFAKRLTACYPNMKPHDAERYSVALVKVFASYPASLCRRVIDPVHGLPGRLTYMPNTGDVNQALQAEFKRRDVIRANALSHIRERERRELEAAEEEKYKQGSAEHRAAVVKKALSALKAIPGDAGDH